MFERLAVGALMAASPPRLFDYIAGRHWQRSMLEEWTGGFPFRPGGSILDVGCGPGALSASLQAAGANVTGLDRSSRMIALARRKYSGGGARFAEGDALALPFGEGTFQAVVAASLVNVVTGPEVLIAEMTRVTAVGGYVSVLFPVLEFDTAKVDRIADELVVAGFSRTVLGCWQAWSRKLSPETVSGLFEDAGLSEISVRPLLSGAAASVTGRKVTSIGGT